MYVIVGPRELDYNDVPLVKETDNYFTFQITKGNELFSAEELDSQFIHDRYKDNPYVAEDEIRELMSDQPSTHIDTRDSGILMQVNGRIPKIQEEMPHNSLLAVLEE